MKLFVIRRKYLALAAAAVLLGAAAWSFALPDSVPAAATTRQLPIYCVECEGKRCAISFDAAWGDVVVRQCKRIENY